MAADVIWPTDVLKPTAGKSKVRAATIGGGRTIAGLEQVIANDAGFWALTMGAITVRNNEGMRLWNEIEVILQGRSGTALVPFLDCHRAPWPLDEDGNPTTTGGDIPFSDGSFFSDGTGFSQPVVYIDTETAIAAGAVTGSLRVVAGGELKAGMHFSVGERGYRISKINGVATGGGEIVYNVTFWPPAREAIDAAVELEFQEPVFRARLATDDEMDFDPELWKFGRPTINWVEDV